MGGDGNVDGVSGRGSVKQQEHDHEDPTRPPRYSKQAYFWLALPKTIGGV